MDIPTTARPEGPPLRFERRVSCEDEDGRPYAVLIYQEDGPPGLCQAFLDEPFRRRRLAPVEGGAAFRIPGEATRLRPVEDGDPPRHLLDPIDAYRLSLPDAPSRSEAVRRLVRAALAAWQAGAGSRSGR